MYLSQIYDKVHAHEAKPCIKSYVMSIIDYSVEPIYFFLGKRGFG